MPVVKIYHCDIDEMDTVRVEHETGHVRLATQSFNTDIALFLTPDTAQKLSRAIASVVDEALKYRERNADE